MEAWTKSLAASVLIQKFESSQIRVAVTELFWTAKGSRMGRGMAELVLSETERTELKLLSSRRKTAQALALRARIVLECARGLENQEVAANLGIAKNTVGKWRRRFVERRMDGLPDPGVGSQPTHAAHAARPGRPA